MEAGRSTTGSMLRAKSSDREYRPTGRSAGAASVTAFDSRLEQHASTLVPLLPGGAFVPVPVSFCAAPPGFGPMGALQLPPDAYASGQLQRASYAHYSLPMSTLLQQHAAPCACVECVGVGAGATDGVPTLFRPVATYGARTPAPGAQQSGAAALALQAPSTSSSGSDPNHNKAAAIQITDRSVMLQSFEVGGDCEQCARVPTLQQKEAGAALTAADRNRRPLVRKPLAIYSQASYV